MPWVEASYMPGFVADLTSWETEIERDGRLSQVVRSGRGGSRGRREERHTTRLAPAQVAELERRIAAIDFPAVAAAFRSITIEDLEHIRIRIDGEPALSFGGALLFWERQARRDRRHACPEVVEAARLWRMIDGFSPHRLGA